MSWLPDGQIVFGLADGKVLKLTHLKDFTLSTNYFHKFRSDLVM